MRLAARDEEAAAIGALGPTVGAEALVHLIPARVLLLLHDGHDGAAVEAREEGAQLGVGAQREVGVAQVDQVLEVQPAPA